MEQLTPYSKQFVAWVTGLTDRYRFDPGFRTMVHIIALQVGLAVLSILIIAWAINYAQSGTVGTITNHVKLIVAGSTTGNTTLPQSITDVRRATYAYVFIGLVLLNILFGYLIAHFALRPTRENLGFQKRFIGNIAHEIRTPLSIIKTSTEVALFDTRLSPPMRETLDGIVRELDRISETINNLLSFDTLSRPRTINMVSLNLSEVAAQVVERHQSLAESRGVELSLHASPDMLVNGNETALDQVVTNLVKNAINYTPEHKNGHVSVTVEPGPMNTVSLFVRDTGIGIDQKDMRHIFEPFYRADTSRARGIGTGSSGLGLAIVNEIVRLHRGRIFVRSVSGEGTTIRINFPATRVSRRDMRSRALFHTADNAPPV